MLVGIHRRWVEWELSQLAVDALEQNAGPADLPGATEVSLLFCDLCEFVAYAEEHGDAAAVDAVERFGEVVFDARGERGHVVKGLGDGWMLVFPAPADAVATAERIFMRGAALGIPPIHASVNHGEAVHRDGDWFGREVNLAARLLTWAGEGELLATEQVVTAVPDRAWQRVRRRRVRGVRHPVTAYCVRPVR
jgi:adenylate cyclase